MSGVATTAILFIFAVLFFGVMNDAGVFDVIVGKVLKLVGNNITLLMFATVLIAFIGHLDGSGATTMLICIPPLLPIYKEMNVRPINLLCITTLTMGVMNIVPWGGPCGRTAAALEVSTSEIWKYCIPAQVVGIVMILGLCVLLSRNEKKRGAGYKPAAEEETVSVETAAAVGAAFLITFGPAIYIMPITAATYMGLGLTNVELKDHIAFSYK